MRILILCLILPSAFLALGINVNQNSTSNILGLLVAVAGAIFTIMSIWVAFLYPNILRTLKGENLVNADFSAGGEETSRLKQIISVIIQSALVMIFSILALLASASIEGIPFNKKEYAEGAIQFVVLYLSCVQIVALTSTILINYTFISTLDKQRKKRAKDHDT